MSVPARPGLANLTTGSNVHNQSAGKAFSGSPRPPDASVERLGDLMHLDVTYPHHNDDHSVPDAALSALVRELRLNLELGSALEVELGGYAK